MYKGGWREANISAFCIFLSSHVSMAPSSNIYKIFINYIYLKMKFGLDLQDMGLLKSYMSISKFLKGNKQVVYSSIIVE